MCFAMCSGEWVRGRPVNSCKEGTLDHDQLYLDTEHEVSLSKTQQAQLNKAECANLHSHCVHFFI